MIELLAKVIPLGIASTMSPGILAVTVALLSGPHPKRRTFAFLLGQVVTVFILAVAGATLGNGLEDAQTTAPGSVNSVNLFLGIIMLVFGFVALRQKSDATKMKDANAVSPDLLKWLFFGFILSITNLDAVFLYLAAVKEIYQATISHLAELVLMTYSSLMFLLPCLLPLCLYIMMPATAEKTLRPVSVVMKKYGNSLVAAIFFIFGAYLVLKGIGVV